MKNIMKNIWKPDENAQSAAGCLMIVLVMIGMIAGCLLIEIFWL